MTAESGLLDDVRDVPTWTPEATQLGDLELLLSGAFRPLTGFLGSADAAAVRADGRLADGTPWPEPVILPVPAELADHQRLVLANPEGVPVGLLTVTEAWRDGAQWCLAGPVEPLRAVRHGPFLRWRRTPEETRAELARPGEQVRPPVEAAGRPPAPARVLAVTTAAPLHRRRLGQIRHAAERLGARVLLLPLTGGGHPHSLVRAVLAARPELPPDSLVATVPLGPRPGARRELTLHAHVAAAYGATHLLADEPAADTDTPIPVVTTEPWAYDTGFEIWRPVSKIEPDHLRPELADEELAGLLDEGAAIPDWLTSPAVARELRRARPPRHERGLTVLFTGLSGSGKSTLASALADALVECGGRSVSLLDGDVVRRLLSAGLTFSKSDRDLNIRRIGFVAAEISRHGGIAICAPIAPYAATRAEVRRMVSEVADFVLIHVNTPLEECERRDLKGLYAKARAGRIPAFTGVSDPYEAPTDADLTLDTSRLTPQEALESIIRLLTEGGWIRADGV